MTNFVKIWVGRGLITHLVSVSVTEFTWLGGCVRSKLLTRASKIQIYINFTSLRSVKAQKAAMGASWWKKRKCVYGWRYFATVFSSKKRGKPRLW